MKQIGADRDYDSGKINRDTCTSKGLHIGAKISIFDWV